MASERLGLSITECTRWGLGVGGWGLVNLPLPFPFPKPVEVVTDVNDMMHSSASVAEMALLRAAPQSWNIVQIRTDCLIAIEVFHFEPLS